MEKAEFDFFALPVGEVPNVFFRKLSIRISRLWK
jgi:hypothetical protein